MANFIFFTTANEVVEGGKMNTLIDLWLFELCDPDEFVSLAAYGRLCRVDSIRVEAGYDAMRRVSRRLKRFAEEALGDAESSLDGWLDEANELASACDQALANASDKDVNVSELAYKAESLLIDLDDAELVVWVAKKAGVKERFWRRINKRIKKCSKWLVENLSRFFPAGEFIREVCEYLRDDIDNDKELAATANKFRLILDAMNEADRLLRS